MGFTTPRPAVVVPHQAQYACGRVGGSFHNFKVGIDEVIDDGMGHTVPCRQTTTCPWINCRYNRGWYQNRYEKDVYDWMAEILKL